MNKKSVLFLFFICFFKGAFFISVDNQLQVSKFFHKNEKSTQKVTKSRSVAEWTFLVFMQADNSLFPFVLQDLVEMARVGNSSKLNIVVQIDCPILFSQLFGPGNIRVQIEPGFAQVVDVLPVDIMGIDVVGALIDAARWMVSDYPANHYIIDLWDHGRGILDPEPVKSILFDDTYGTFMNNQQMKQALDSIKSNVLDGKKLDILGMDACLMSMLEVGYQIKENVNYLVSSQASASAFGWDYAGFLQPMSERNLTSLQVVKNIVSSYKAFYSKENITNVWAQSGIDLNKIEALKQNIDSLVQNLNVLKQIDTPKINYIIRKARLSSLEFDSNNNYIDLGTFYNQLYNQLSITRQEDLSSLRTLSSYEQQSEITKQIITLGLKLLNEAVVSNVVSPDLALAQGLSIYFPRAETQSSYPKTLFAQESLWLELFPEQA